MHKGFHVNTFNAQNTSRPPQWRLQVKGLPDCD